MMNPLIGKRVRITIMRGIEQKRVISKAEGVLCDIKPMKTEFDHVETWSALVLRDDGTVKMIELLFDYRFVVLEN